MVDMMDETDGVVRTAMEEDKAGTEEEMDTLEVDKADINKGTDEDAHVL